MSSSPRKVSLLADADYIKRIYSDDKSFQPCTTCSFTTTIVNNEHDERNDNHHHQQQHFITIKATERQKLQNVINRRISKFYNLFDPMIDFLLINRYAMLNKQRNHHVETIPTDHIIVMHLADLLPAANAAIPPQLRIDKLEPRAVADLNDAERSMLERDLSWQKKPQEVRIAHLVSYKLHSVGHHHHHVWTTVRTNSYDFNPLIVGRAGQRALMERLIAFSQGINEIARGDRPDIYDMIKRQMKEARRSRSRDDEASGGVSSLGSSTCCCVEESSSCGENDLDKENNNMCLMSKTRRRRSDDGNELTAKTCWRER